MLERIKEQIEDMLVTPIVNDTKEWCELFLRNSSLPRRSPEYSGHSFLKLHIDTISEYKAKMLDNLKNMEKESERVATLTQRMMEPPLMEHPMMESERASAKRRRRTRYMENTVYLAPSAWSSTRRA